MGYPIPKGFERRGERGSEVNPGREIVPPASTTKAQQRSSSGFYSWGVSVAKRPWRRFGKPECLLLDTKLLELLICSLLVMLIQSDLFSENVRSHRLRRL